MREQGAGDPSTNQAKDAGQCPSKGSQDAGSLEYLTVASNSKTVRRSTILVAILVCIGLLGLGYMIRQSRPQTALGQQIDEEQAKIEVAIGRLTGVGSEMLSKMDQILKRFGEFSNVLQVQVNELVKDPFDVEVFAKPDAEASVGSEDAADLAAYNLRQYAKQRAGTLVLLSVMQSGRANSCMINDQLLQEGDMIEGFVIDRIGRDFVELTWRGDKGPASGQAADTNGFKTVLKLSQ